MLRSLTFGRAGTRRRARETRRALPRMWQDPLPIAVVFSKAARYSWRGTNDEVGWCFLVRTTRGHRRQASGRTLGFGIGGLVRMLSIPKYKNLLLSRFLTKFLSPLGFSRHNFLCLCGDGATQHNTQPGMHRSSQRRTGASAGDKPPRVKWRSV
jgi:hypothetical protein